MIAAPYSLHIGLNSKHYLYIGSFYRQSNDLSFWFEFIFQLQFSPHKLYKNKNQEIKFCKNYE